MSKSRRRFVRPALGAVALLSAGVALPAQGGAGVTSDAAADQALHASNPTAPATGPATTSTTSIAGIDLGRLSIAGLHVKARQDDPPDDGGTLVTFADGGDVVRVSVRVAVAPDVAVARAFFDAQLRGFAARLPPAVDASLGDTAFASDGGRGDSAVVGMTGNVAYDVRIVDDENAPPGLPTAAAIAVQIRALLVAGAPVFPAPRLSLPSDISVATGGPVGISSVPGQHLKLRADGGYIARGAGGPVVRPFGPGPVTVIATVVDDLGRVGVARAMATAR